MSSKSEDALSAPAPIFLRTSRSQRRRLRVVAANADQTYVEFVMDAVERAEAAMRKQMGSQASPLHRAGAVGGNPWA